MRPDQMRIVLQQDAPEPMLRAEVAEPIGWMVGGTNRLELRLVKFHPWVDPFVRLLSGALRLAATGD